MKTSAPSTDPRPSFVAKHRIAIWRLLFVGLASMLIAGSPGWADSGLAAAMRLLGVVLVSTAAVGRLWCALYISGRKSVELVTSGPYSLCRHPLYLFNLLGFLGVAAMSESLVVVVIAGLAFAVLYPGVIASEERLLQHRFEGFDAYRRSVPTLWPRLQGYRSPRHWQVEIHAFTRNVADSVWFLGLAGAVELLDVAHSSGWLRGYFVLY